jgi:hypothetical protein
MKAMARQRSHSIAFKRQLRPAVDIGPISALSERETYSFEDKVVDFAALRKAVSRSAS